MVYLNALKRLALEWITYTASGMHFINGHLECIRRLPFSPQELLHRTRRVVKLVVCFIHICKIHKIQDLLLKKSCPHKKQV